MKVLLTFDVELWCNSWTDLDQLFPSAFERYVYGHSKHGNYALPRTLEILNAHGLQGVFFVEPLFAARFGERYLRVIVDMIRDAGQDIQLHLHPEWTDEISPAIISNNRVKRQHLSHYTGDEQAALIAYGKQLLEAAAGPVSAFRAGSFACNRDTFKALQANDIAIDSSLNAYYDVSGADLRDCPWRSTPSKLEGVNSFPVSLFVDGLGKLRPAQLAGCGLGELCDAMESAATAGQPEFILVSHNFEMLKRGSSQPDWIVVRRFERLCRFLNENRDRFPTSVYSQCRVGDRSVGKKWPKARLAATLTRHSEQLLRRF